MCNILMSIIVGEEFMTENNKISNPWEIYGNLMRLMHFDTEGKNLQDFSTQVFEAAGKDLQEDKKTQRKSYKPEKLSSTTHLDKCISDFVDQIATENVTNEDKITLRNNIIKSITEHGEYNKLKDTLDYVRVQGVGKDVIHKIGAIVGIVGRAVAPTLSVAMAALSVFVEAQSYNHSNQAMRDVFRGDAEGVALNGLAANWEHKQARASAEASGSLWDMGTKPTIELNEIR